MKTARAIRSILILGYLMAPSGSVHAGPEDKGPGVLQTVIFVKDDVEHQLTLWWQRLGSPTYSQAEFKAFLKKRGITEKDLPLFQAFAFILTDSPLDQPERRRIVWIGYDEILQSRKEWTADIVSRPGENQIFVVLLQDLFPVIHLKVYSTDLRSTIEEHLPLEFTLHSFDAWPKPPKPVAEMKVHLASLVPGKYNCSVSSFQTIPARDHLLIYGERDNKECEPVCLVLDLKTNIFSIGTVREKELKDRFYEYLKQQQSQTNP